MSLAAIQQFITNLVRDDNAKISVTQRDEAIALAVERYSEDRPYQKVEDRVSALGGSTLALPAGWEADFSRLFSMEYPIGEVPPTLIRSELWKLYRTPTGDVIQLIDGLAAGATVRMTYGVHHKVDGANDTVPLKDRQAFCLWAAAILCDQLAAFYSNRSDSTISADTVQRDTQASSYRAMAVKYRKDYFNAIGVDEKRNVAAGAVTSLSTKDSVGGPRMFHPPFGPR